MIIEEVKKKPYLFKLENGRIISVEFLDDRRIKIKLDQKVTFRDWVFGKHRTKGTVRKICYPDTQGRSHNILLVEVVGKIGLSAVKIGDLIL